jgi:hypothetical protein
MIKQIANSFGFTVVARKASEARSVISAKDFTRILDRNGLSPLCDLFYKFKAFSVDFYDSSEIESTSRATSYIISLLKKPGYSFATYTDKDQTVYVLGAKDMELGNFDSFVKQVNKHPELVEQLNGLLEEI